MFACLSTNVLNLANERTTDNQASLLVIWDLVCAIVFQIGTIL